mgnify:CR=1 FL=1
MADNKGTVISRSELLQMSSDIVSSYLGNNAVATSQISDVIEKVYGTVASLAGDETAGLNMEDNPAVPVRRSVTPDYLVCLEDEASSAHKLQHDPGRIPGQVAVAGGLPDGCPELCGAAVRICQEDWSWSSVRENDDTLKNF